MGKFIDLTGQRFGRLVVKTRVENKGVHTAWLCKCDCGSECVVTANSLRTKHTQSCGCLQKENTSSSRFSDLTGNLFGRLYVDSIYGKDKNGNYLYNCLCKCGATRIVNGSNLVRGNTKSCGCFSADNKRKRLKDLTGNRYGQLTVLEYRGKSIHNKSVWLCLCDCGELCIVNGNDLKSGQARSCGCLLSVGETEIKSVLDRLRIKYIRQKRFIGCKDKKSLPFDFYCYEYNIAIEYDGIYHYDPEKCFGGDFRIIQLHDQIKTKYCEENDILLLRIPYWERHNISQIINDFFMINCDEEANSSDAGLSA